MPRSSFVAISTMGNVSPVAMLSPTARFLACWKVCVSALSNTMAATSTLVRSTLGSLAAAALEACSRQWGEEHKLAHSVDHTTPRASIEPTRTLHMMLRFDAYQHLKVRTTQAFNNCDCVILCSSFTFTTTIQRTHLTQHKRSYSITTTTTVEQYKHKPP